MYCREVVQGGEEAALDQCCLPAEYPPKSLCLLEGWTLMSASVYLCSCLCLVQSGPQLTRGTSTSQTCKIGMRKIFPSSITLHLRHNVISLVSVLCLACNSLLRIFVNSDSSLTLPLDLVFVLLSKSKLWLNHEAEDYLLIHVCIFFILKIGPREFLR